MLEILGFDRNDPGDAQDFVRWLVNKCLWVFVILASVIMIHAIFKAGNGSLPPEPQWWLDFEQAIGVTW